MADVSVRPARGEDAERIAGVQLLTWRTAYAAFLPADALDVPPEQAADLWRRAIDAPPSTRHRVLVALEGVEVVGLAASGPADAEDSDVVELFNLLVEPRWGRRGHGSRLLAASVDHWRTEAVTRATAWVWERDAASLAFLRSAGWALDGARRGLDTGPRVQTQVRLHADVSA